MFHTGRITSCCDLRVGPKLHPSPFTQGITCCCDSINCFLSDGFSKNTNRSKRGPSHPSKAAERSPDRDEASPSPARLLRRRSLTRAPADTKASSSSIGPRPCLLASPGLLPRRNSRSTINVSNCSLTADKDAFAAVEGWLGERPLSSEVADGDGASPASGAAAAFVLASSPNDVPTAESFGGEKKHLGRAVI